MRRPSAPAARGFARGMIKFEVAGRQRSDLLRRDIVMHQIVTRPIGRHRDNVANA
ncbi:MAG: hypothetical protein AAGF48_02715 [Pseudomonadota bacterium]